MNTKSRVRFAAEEVSVVVPTELTDGFSPEELQACWVSRSDEAIAERDRRATFRALRRCRRDPSTFPCTDFTLRGIEEDIDSTYATALVEQTKLVWRLVKETAKGEEQEQKKEATEWPESQETKGNTHVIQSDKIRAAIEGITTAAAQMAVEVGKNDEIAVRELDAKAEFDQLLIVQTWAKDFTSRRNGGPKKPSATAGRTNQESRLPQRRMDSLNQASRFIIELAA